MPSEALCLLLWPWCEGAHPDYSFIRPGSGVAATFYDITASDMHFLRTGQTGLPLLAVGADKLPALISLALTR